MGRSIIRRTTLLVVVISVAIGCVSAAYQVHVGYRQGMLEIEKQLRVIETSHVPALASNL